MRTLCEWILLGLGVGLNIIAKYLIIGAAWCLDHNEIVAEFKEAQK